MNISTTIGSYVSGFNYTIGELTVDMKIVSFIVRGRSFEIIRYKRNYNMSLVRFGITFKGKVVNIFIPFYQSSGSNSSTVGAGTWFPFHCVSQKRESGPREYYYRSQYGSSYIFKMGHYYKEPFSGRCEGVDPALGNNIISPLIGSSSCVRQRNFIIEHTSEIPNEILHPEVDKGIGVHSILLRFGNLLYLTASYFLFGNPPGWNLSNFPSDSKEHAFARVLTRISSFGKFGNETWYQISSRLPRTNFNPRSVYNADDSGVLNYILMMNNVPMPHYQDVLRSDNGNDAKFITYMKLLQIIGELYLDASSQSLWERFFTTFDRASKINNIPITDTDDLNIDNDFHVWLLPEIFSGNNNLVRLYRFV